MGTDKKRPNIVVFVAEDLDYEGVNCFDSAQTGYTGIVRSGNQAADWPRPLGRMLTPSIDRLARDGVLGTNYYCVSAICTPARYSILTGRYPERSAEFCRNHPPGTHANVWFNTSICRDESNIARVLQTDGYRTGFIGKWHNWPAELKAWLAPHYYDNDPDGDPRDPEIQSVISEAYDAAVEHLASGYGWDVVDRLYFDNPEPFTPDILSGHNLDWTVEGACDFLDDCEHREEPFFLYVAATVPHSRYSARSFANNDPRASAAGLLDNPPDVMPSRRNMMDRAAAAGLEEDAVEGVWLDDGVAAIRSKLRDIGEADNTCFVFTTDHPTAGKGTTHLGRIPLVINWPGRIQPGTICHDLLAETDLTPTLLDIAGCDIPPEMQTDGHSFKAALTAESQHSQRKEVLLEVGHSRAIVTDNWKLIANRLPVEDSRNEQDLHHVSWQNVSPDAPSSVKWSADRLFPAYFDADHLYDLENDPMEQNNLVGDREHAEVTCELRDALSQALQKLPHSFGELTE